MKKFLLYISAWVLFVFIVAEITIRVFGLAAKTLPMYNLDGDYVIQPGETGYWKRGGLKEINNYYSINSQGYNSIIDFNELNSNNLNIALIGDSYIEGFQTNVKYSIGRQLEKMLGVNVVVHEYGRAGANIIDFVKVYNKILKPKQYDFTFILATDKDLRAKKANNMGKGNRVSEKSTTSKIYDNIHIISYLNINHGFGKHFNDLISKGPESIEKIHFNKESKKITEEQYLKNLNKDALKLLPKNIIFLYEDQKLNEFFLKNYKFEFKEINHTRKPINHGFDKHWNINGRFNCAKAMADYIKDHK